MYKHKDGVELNKLTRDEAQVLWHYRTDVWWGTHRVSITNLEDQDFWFDKLSDTDFVMLGRCWFESNMRKVIAVRYYDIDWINRSLSISAFMCPEIKLCQNETKAAFSAGLDFAFEMLNMNRVQAEVLANNRAAQVLETQHLGFKVEGVRRKAVYKCGMYIDSIMLGLLREEWQQQSRVVAYGGSCNENFDAIKAQKYIGQSYAKLNIGPFTF